MSSGWTIDTLKEHFDTRLVEKDLRDQQRFEGQGVALAAARSADRELVAAALASADKRLEGMNEFRQALSDQAGTFATKDEVDAKITGLSKEINALTTAMASRDGAGKGLHSGWVLLTSAVALAIAAFSMFHPIK